MTLESNCVSTITRHYERTWGKSYECTRWASGPIADLGPEFGVRVFPPHGKRVMWTYATAGMSRPSDRKCIELHLFAPRKDDRLVELLTVVAHYHRTGRQIGIGHTINFGRPWLDESMCTHGFVSLPYLDGPTIEILDDSESGLRAQCLWLIPITPEELEFKKKHGAAALEQQFESSDINYVDPARASVV